MEESQPAEPAEGAPPPTAEERERSPNLPAIVGLMVSVVGLGLGFCVTPLGFLGLLGAGISVIGLFRQPRGMAIAGVIIGLFATATAIAPILLAPPPEPERQQQEAPLQP